MTTSWRLPVREVDMSADSQSFVSKYQALLNNPTFMLQTYTSRWEETANPVYAWKAIKKCTEHNLPLPAWVSAYFVAVADRMLSEEASQSPDLRQVLPSILGFRMKRGPGRPLDPDADGPDKMLF